MSPTHAPPADLYLRGLPDGRVLLIYPLSFNRARVQLYAAGRWLTADDEW